MPYNEQIVGFSREIVDTRGCIDLRTYLGFEQDAKELKTRFLLVEVSTPYNVIIGSPFLNAFGAIISTPDLILKFHSNKGTICTAWVDQNIARECYVHG